MSAYTHSMESSGHSHDRGHFHGYGNGHANELLEANRGHFDSVAKEHDGYDSHPVVISVTQQVAAVLHSHYPFNAESTVIMDYACGTGRVSRLLAAHAKEIVGVDISQGMVDEFNNHVEEEKISPKAVHAICAELKGEEGELDGKNFDIIMCTQSYHHIADVRAATKTLVFFLKPSGKLFVVDMMPHDGNDFHNDTRYKNAAHTVSHKHGFTENEMKDIFQEAGLTEFTLIPNVALVEYGEKVGSLFLAHGTKPK